MSDHRTLLRRWRGRVGRLATLLGVSPSTVWRWRNGESVPMHPGTARLIGWMVKMSDAELRQVEGHALRHEWADAIELIARTGGRR